MSKESFKVFVRDNQSLIKYVNNNSMTWQKFYEMYELYGSNNSVWDNYINQNDLTRNHNLSNADSAFKELVNVVKGLNLEKVQKGINSIQKTISLVQELGIGTAAGAATSSYESRPVYQHFDD